MTVFKGFLIITKRNLLMVFMYLAIFLTIGILASGSDSNTSVSGFHAQTLTVGVVDHDGGVLSKGLSTGEPSWRWPNGPERLLVLSQAAGRSSQFAGRLGLRCRCAATDSD